VGLLKKGERLKNALAMPRPSWPAPPEPVALVPLHCQGNATQKRAAADRQLSPALIRIDYMLTKILGIQALSSDASLLSSQHLETQNQQNRNPSRVSQSLNRSNLHNAPLPCI
jgi:hypothetical protein